MDTKRMRYLTDNLRSLETARFECPNWAFVGFKTDFISAINKPVIRIADNPSDNQPLELCRELNAAITPVIEKWIEKIKAQIKKEVG